MGSSTIRYPRPGPRARTANVTWRVPLSLRACTFRQLTPFRICSTTASPGDASGLLAVSVPDCPPGPLATLADTGA